MDSAEVLTEAAVLHHTKVPLPEIKKFDLWGFSYRDVSIISKMTNLEVLSLAGNQISSLAPFAACPHLSHLILRNNRISEFTELEHLAALPNLRILWLADNPIASQSQYRERVVQILPKILKLDEAPITEFDRRPPQLSSGPGRIPVDGISDMDGLSLSQRPGTSHLPAIDAPRPQPNRFAKTQPKALIAHLTVPEPVKAPITRPMGDLPKPTSGRAQILPYRSAAPQLQPPPREDDHALLTAVLALLPELSQDSLDQVARALVDLSKR
jgi:hypothetical protein